MTMFNIWMLMIGRSVVFRIAPNGFGLCVRFCLAESSDLSTNVNGKTCTKPVLYEGGISRTTPD
jgi:hypothetical protein